MIKRIFIVLIWLFILATFIGCNGGKGDTHSHDSIFDVKEGEHLSNEEISAIISNIPSDKYESYPNMHTMPLSATLYKDGEKTSIDVDDPRLIRLINFFNQCVYYSKCAYTQGLYSLNDLEDGIVNGEFRLELTYAPYGTEAPSPYGKCTTMCDTIIITNTDSFTLIAHDLQGYEGEEESYPDYAVGFFPLYYSSPWLDLFGF